MRARLDPTGRRRAGGLAHKCASAGRETEFRLISGRAVGAFRDDLQLSKFFISVLSTIYSI